MANKFVAASKNFLQKPWRKFWWLALLVIFELARDRLAAWANSQIDKQIENKSGWLMEMTARAVSYLASTPLSWTISAAIIVLLVLFIHSYFSDASTARETVAKPAPKQTPREILATMATPTTPIPSGPPYPDLKLAGLARSHLGITNFSDPDPDGRVGRFLHRVREAALHKRIQIWGRKDCDEEWEDLDIVPRDEIPAKNWSGCKISEYEFQTNDGRAVTAQDGDRDWEYYADLHVYRQQAKKIFPSKDTKHDWNLSQAFQYWAANTDRSDTFHNGVEQAAFDEHITVWGKRGFRMNAIFEKIPPNHWTTSGITPHPVIYAGPEGLEETFILENSRTTPRNKGDTSIEQYWYVKVSSEEIKTLWPVANT